MVEVTLNPGASTTIEKWVTVPENPPKLDFVLLIDLSDSYTDHLPNIKSLYDGLIDAIRADVPDSQFGVTSFVDFPFTPWGATSTLDYAYKRDLDLTSSKVSASSTVTGLATKVGSDIPESQYEALFQTASGAGRDIDGDGLFDKVGEIAPGLGISWRSGSTRVIAITTDAPFHDPGDLCPSFSLFTCDDSYPDLEDVGYPGPHATTTIAALNANGIKVIALKAPGSTIQMDAVAAATGGSATSTSATSDDIADAILAGLAALTFSLDVQIEAEGSGVCDLDITFDTAFPVDVVGGETIHFNETITVPDNTDASSLRCVVTFTADGEPLGDQTIWIDVFEGVVDIDIKPNSDPSSFACNSSESIPVAVLGSATFDATEIDAHTVTFGITGTETGEVHFKEGKAKRHVEDFNKDGFLDMIFHFDFPSTGFSCAGIPAGGSVITDGTLNGQLFDEDGPEFTGTSDIRLTSG